MQQRDASDEAADKMQTGQGSPMPDAVKSHAVRDARPSIVSQHEKLCAHLGFMDDAINRTLFINEAACVP